MARRIRFYGKKRGDRRTGSRIWGSAGLALFLAAFFAGGWVLLAIMLRTLVIPEWRANRHFAPLTCVVLKTRIGQADGENGRLFRPEVLIQYQVGGRSHETWTYSIANYHDEGYSGGKEGKQALVDRFTIGQEYPCWYDPSDPSRAVLVRGYTWVAWAMLLLPASFIVIGGTGLGYLVLNWGKSAERWASIAQQAEHAVNLERFENPPTADSLPCVPSDVNLTNSPGVKLAYRLPTAASPAWVLLGLFSATVAWNVMVAAFIAIAIRGFLRRDPDWFLTTVSVPILVVGVLLIYFSIKRLLLATSFGPTLVEISDHPLYPGGTYRITLSQAGRLRMDSLEVSLVCEEKATYQQGTNIRTDVCIVHRERVSRHEGIEMQGGRPYEAESLLKVPQAAMHSFRARHNEVGWKLVVQADVSGWPRYQRDFPLAVYPHSNGVEKE